MLVLGSCGAWPAAGDACSGFLVEHEGFRLVLDLGYATLPRLLAVTPAESIDAVLISHGHPDHCADLNPFLRARALRDDPAPAVPVHAPAGALDRVLALDRPGMLDDAYELRLFAPGDRFDIGPFHVATWALPHMVPNAGVRLSAGSRTLAYTGDTGPSPVLAELARHADLLLAEATYAEEVPDESRAFLFSARQAGELASEAGAKRLVLTHLMPGADPERSLAAARRRYQGDVTVAHSGETYDLTMSDLT